MEIAVILSSIGVCIAFWWTWCEIERLSDLLARTIENIVVVIKKNDKIVALDKEILAAHPLALENIEETFRLIKLFQDQQKHLAEIRKEWIAANALLAESLEAAVCIGGEAKPDEALKYLRLAKEKYGGSFAKAPPGVTVDIHDSHTGQEFKK